MAEQPARPGSPGYFREKAKEMLKQAEAAPDGIARAQFLVLAEQWRRLAETIEHPHW
ncbi:MAG TPA: hypothetical protein VFI23_10940 [Rhizomicrobium sp.]|nr:hypothetical protein [Rhizomicrobium sp.]